MNRTEYFQKQKELARAAYRCETEAIRRIRACTRELVLPLVRQYMEHGTLTFPVEELARRIDHIIREEGAKPVQAARKIQEEMETSLAEKLGISLPPRPEPEQNARMRQGNAGRQPIGATTKITGKAWAYGTQGVAAYYRDPQTGKIVWTDTPLEYMFRKRADLSTLVWKAVEEQEQMVLDVVRGGRAAGRNVKDIAKDLETFINYGDGGKRVVGRWMGMFPNTEAGRKEAWQREYLKAHGGFQPRSDAAKALLREPDAKEWVQQKMAETTKRGTPRLPDAVKQYAVRLGRAGLDHRAIRIARTETTAMLADEQTEIARNSAICDGTMDFVMDRGRDHWNCQCEKYAAQSPWKVDDPNRPEIPIHPNCMCEWRPRLKTNEEILATFRERRKGDIEAVRADIDAKQEYQFSKISNEEFNYDISPNNDMAERKILSSMMQERGIYADFDESKREAIDYIPNICDHISMDFPKFGKAVKTIGYSEYLHDFQGAYFNPHNHELIYNKNIFMSEKNIEEYLNKTPGHFASTNKRSIINHEFGHAIEKLIMQTSGDENIVRKEVLSVLIENGFETMDDVKKGISIYAADETLHDTVAEAVSDYLSEDKPRKISILIYNRLIDIYRRFI